MAAGLATLNHLTPEVYAKISAMTEALVSGIIAVAKKHDIQLQENHVCGMFSFFFTNERVKDYDAVAKSNIEFFSAFFHEMLSQGIYLGPSAFAAGFLSAKHGETEIDRTIQAADAAFATLARA